MVLNIRRKLCKIFRILYSESINVPQGFSCLRGIGSCLRRGLRKQAIPSKQQIDWGTLVDSHYAKLDQDSAYDLLQEYKFLPLI